MPAERLSMRKIYEILRLKYGHRLSNREVAACRQAETVADYLLFQAAGLSWPLPDGLDEAVRATTVSLGESGKATKQAATRLGRGAAGTAP